MPESAGGCRIGNPAEKVRRVDMFVPRGETQVEKQASGRAMRIFGIVMTVRAVVLFVISFA